MGDVNLQWSTASDVDFEIEPDDGQEEEKTPEEVAAEEAQQRQQQELLENANIGKQVAEGLSQLGLQLSETQKQTLEAVKAAKSGSGEKPASQQTKSQLESVISEIGDNFYDNPTESAAKIARAAVHDDLGPLLQQIIGVVKETATETGKVSSQGDPTIKFVMEKYPDEIQEKLTNMPPGPKAYRDACQQVAASHLSEVVQAQVQAALEETKAKDNEPTRDETFSEAGATSSARPATKPKVKVKISPEQLAKDKQWAMDQGLDWKYAAERLYGEKIAAQLAKQERR